jgi:hypothetical protein
VKFHLLFITSILIVRVTLIGLQQRTDGFACTRQIMAIICALTAPKGHRQVDLSHSLTHSLSLSLSLSLYLSQSASPI